MSKTKRIKILEKQVKELGKNQRTLYGAVHNLDRRLTQYLDAGIQEFVEEHERGRATYPDGGDPMPTEEQSSTTELARERTEDLNHMKGA